AREAEIERVRSVFMGNHATPEKAPHLHARYDADEIFDRANRLAAQWRQGGLEIGKDFDYDDVVSYLELDSKKRLAPILGSSPARQVSAGAPPTAAGPGNAPKVPANGPR